MSKATGRRGPGGRNVARGERGPPSPHNRDAEAEALGMAIADKRVLDELTRRLTPADFYRREHAEVARALAALRERGELATEVTVAQFLVDEAALDDLRDEARAKPLVLELVDTASTTSRALAAVDKVADLSRRRRGIRSAAKVTRALQNGSEPELFIEAVDELLELRSPARGDQSPTDVEEIDDFLSGDEPDVDWLIPDVMERADRMIVTGREGSGKSTLLEQMVVQVAAGLHPFRAEDFGGARVLLVDLENPKKVLRRRLRALRIQAGNRYRAGRLFVVRRPGGINVAEEADDRAWLAGVVEHVAAELVVLGPLYKLADGDPNEEKSAKPVVKFLDDLRTRNSCALILEAHMPHDGKGRPYGWSGWRRWPDIGLELTDTGLLKPWRPARHDTPGIPLALQRGGEWPFTPATRERDVLWARIAAATEGRLTRPTVRELAEELEGATRSSVQRAIDEHREEWEGLADE